MPFILIAFGIAAFVIGIRGTHREAAALLREEWSGARNFFSWVAALGVIGAVGYIPGLQGFSRAFLVLILLVMFLTNGNPDGAGGGFFDQFRRQLLDRPRQSGAAAPPPAASPGGSAGGFPPLPALPQLLPMQPPGN